jgi:hypothetical protein
MMKLIYTILFFISFSLSAKPLKPGCFQIQMGNSLVERCLPENIDFDFIQKKIEIADKVKINDIRLIGSDGEDHLFLAASISGEIQNFCQIEYDRIFDYVVTKNSFQELWRSENRVKEIFANINNVRLLYLLNSYDNPQNKHKCAPLVHLIKTKKISANKGAEYNFLLKEDNFLVIHSDGRPGIFIFNNNFEKIIGSLNILEENFSIIDAEVSWDGRLVAIIRDEVRHVTCLNEYDIETSSRVFSSCGSKSTAYSNLYKEDKEIYVDFKSSLKSAPLISFNRIKSKIKIIKH